MINRKKSIILIAFTIGFLFTVFVLAQTLEAGGGKKNYGNCPVWKIFKNGTANSVDWIKYKPNKRFMIYKSGTPNDPLDDLVLDQETCLVWERAPEPVRMHWNSACGYCWRKDFANRKGGRLPTIEELYTLVDSNNEDPALPNRHPFIDIQSYRYWSNSKRMFNDSFLVQFVDFKTGEHSSGEWHFQHYVWCVRGGHGPSCMP